MKAIRSILTGVIFTLISQLCLSKPNSNPMPYTLGIRDSIMIAHSFHDHPSFGPAGKMHGATYTCDVEFITDQLADEVNWVLDIGYASEMLAEVLAKYNMKNLDEVFGEGIFTTTEFMARRIQMDLAEKLRECKNGSGDCAAEAIFEGRIRVKLFESHKAWASYEADV